MVVELSGPCSEIFWCGDDAGVAEIAREELEAA